MGHFSYFSLQLTPGIIKPDCKNGSRNHHGSIGVSFRAWTLLFLRSLQRRTTRVWESVLCSQARQGERAWILARVVYQTVCNSHFPGRKMSRPALYHHFLGLYFSQDQSRVSGVWLQNRVPFWGMVMPCLTAHMAKSLPGHVHALLNATYSQTPRGLPWF